MKYVKNTILLDSRDLDLKYKIEGQADFDDYIDYLEGTAFNGLEVYIKRFLYPTTAKEGLFSLQKGKQEVNVKLQNISRSENYFIEWIGLGKRRDFGFVAGVIKDGVKSEHYVEFVEKAADVEKAKTAIYIPCRARKFFLLSLVEAIKDLHNNKVVHASLSPFSIGVREGRAWLGGFENAFVEGLGQPVFVKKSGGKLMKRKCEPFYSPELAALADGEKIIVDRRTDIFSLGVFMHWYLSGCLPTTDRPITWFPGSGSCSCGDVYTWKCWNEVAIGGEFYFDSRISPNMQRLLYRMLRCGSREIDAQEVFEALERMLEIDFRGLEESRSYEASLPERRISEIFPRREGMPSVSLKDKTAERPWERKGFETPAKKTQPPKTSEEPPVTWNDFNVDPAEGFVWNADKIGVYKGWRIIDKIYYFYKKDNQEERRPFDTLKILKVILEKASAQPPVKETPPVETPAKKTEQGGQVRVEEEKTAKKPRVENAEMEHIPAKTQPPISGEGRKENGRAFVEEKLYETPKAKKAYAHCEGVSGEELVQALAQIISSLETVKTLSLGTLAPVEVRDEDDTEEKELNTSYALAHFGEDTHAALALMQKAYEAFESEE